MGNIYFGFAGKVFGYDEDFLKFGAGAYQLKEFNSQWDYYSTWFDDPRDQEMIEVGFNIYKKGIIK